MSKLSVSAILNIGSMATFIAFPLLYSASFSGNALFLVPGAALVAFSMVTPFIALKSGGKNP